MAGIGVSSWQILFARFGIKQIDPKAKMSQLSVAQTQLVEICKSLIGPLEVLILDEPTSSLTSAILCHLLA